MPLYHCDAGPLLLDKTQFRRRFRRWFRIDRPRNDRQLSQLKCQRIDLIHTETQTLCDFTTSLFSTMQNIEHFCEELRGFSLHRLRFIRTIAALGNLYTQASIVPFTDQLQGIESVRQRGE